MKEVGSSQKPGHERAQAWARRSLIAVNFFAETNRMEPLLAVYLIEVEGWDVVWVGYVSVVMNVVMIVSQTPAGDLMDKTRRKKLIMAASLIVASVTTAAVAWTSKLYAVILIKALEGIAASLFLPGLIALLLAVVPVEDAPRMVSHAEVSNKLGSVLFTVGTGVAAYFLYPDVGDIFYLLGAGGVAAALFVLGIPSSTIDDRRARDAEGENPAPERTTEASAEDEIPETEDPPPPAEGIDAEGPAKVAESGGEGSEFWGYKEILLNRQIAMFALLTFLYHLSNAAVLPLLAQLVAHEDERTGLVFASVVMCISFFVQAPTAYIVGRTYKKFGYKSLLMLAHTILVLRCATCALLAMYYPNQYALAATQIIDGIGAGLYDTVLPLVVRSLVRGSGRFGVTFGLVVTSWRLGHGFSLLAGEAVLKAAGGRYEASFFALGAGGLLSCLVLGLGVRVPPPSEDGADGGARPTLQRKGSSILLVTVDEDPSDGVRRPSIQRQGSSIPTLQRQGSSIPILQRQGSSITIQRQGSSISILQRTGSSIQLVIANEDRLDDVPGAVQRRRSSFQQGILHIAASDKIEDLDRVESH